MNGEGLSQRNWKYQLRTESVPSQVKVFNSQGQLIRVEQGKTFEQTIGGKNMAQYFVGKPIEIP